MTKDWVKLRKRNEEFEDDGLQRGVAGLTHDLHTCFNEWLVIDMIEWLSNS